MITRIGNTPLREQAIALRLAGKSLREIKRVVSLWIRDMPRPPHLSYEESRKRSAAGVRQFREREYAHREEARTAIAREIGELTEREILIAGAIAYWCEGEKSKPYRRGHDRGCFMNSDPGLVRFFLRFLDAAGLQRSDSIFRVHIHESGDVEGAQRFWAEVTGAPADQFRKPLLKRHNPKTVRKNVAEGYHGCLSEDPNLPKLPGEDSNLCRRHQKPQSCH
jgi:hypothetical protein